jgi:TIR domain
MALLERSAAMPTGLPEAPTSSQARSNGNDPCVPVLPILEVKGQRALERNFIQVFLSHKLKDHSAASAICEVLQANSAEKIKVFMAEDIEKGTVYRQEIEKQLYESDWFILIFTGVDDDDWSWCHHEAGLFCGMSYPDANRVVVFHPPKVDLPDPLRQYEAVKCETNVAGKSEDVDRFFQHLFGEPLYPGLPAINSFFAYRAETTRQQAAAKIIDAVGRLVVESIVPETVLVVHVPDVELLDAVGFPDGTQIRRGSGAMRLFELGDAEIPWSEFLRRLDRELQQCLTPSFWPSMYQACAKSVKNRWLASTHAVLRSPADGRHYMPNLSRVDFTGDNSATFTITFVQVAAGTQAEVRDQRVARIFTALNLSHRFRWEIIDRFATPEKLQAFVDRPGSVDQSLSSVWEMIRLIEIESQNRGVYDPQALPADFGPASEARVRDMFPLWWEKRHHLEKAAAAGDVATFAEVLQELDPINIEFISLAAQRLDELVQVDAHRDRS